LFHFFDWPDWDNPIAMACARLLTFGPVLEPECSSPPLNSFMTWVILRSWPALVRGVFIVLVRSAAAAPQLLELRAGARRLLAVV
jgi:hypothetical protein